MLADQTMGLTVAVLLLAATLYTLCRAVAASGPAARVGRTLHALMTAAMALMLLPGGHWPVLPQFLLFALGAWWFILQAVSRRIRRGDRLPGAAPAKLLYDAAAMAAMAFMLAIGGLGPEVLPGPRGSGPGAHHASAVALPLAVPPAGWSPLAAPEPGPLPAVAFSLAVAFGLAAGLWAARLLFHRRRQWRVRDVADTAVEVLGAAAFAVMFAALAG